MGDQSKKRRAYKSKPKSGEALAAYQAESRKRRNQSLKEKRLKDRENERLAGLYRSREIRENRFLSNISRKAPRTSTPIVVEELDSTDFAAPIRALKIPAVSPDFYRNFLIEEEEENEADEEEENEAEEEEENEAEEHFHQNLSKAPTAEEVEEESLDWNL